MAVTWTTGGTLNNVHGSGSSFGTLTAGAVCGGYRWSPSGAQKYTEEYNGTSWSNGNDATYTAYIVGGAGTQTAGLKWGGLLGGSNYTEEYDGTNWSSGGNFSRSCGGMAGMGTQTAGLSAGGYDTGYLTDAYTYNGTSWSSTGSLTTSRTYTTGQGLGTQSAAMVVSGESGADQTYTATTEKFNGTSWSSGGNVTTGMRNGGAGGSTTSAIKAFGQSSADAYSAKVETYNGTSWSSESDQTALGQYINNDVGNSTTGFMAAGYNAGAGSTASLEYDLGGGEPPAANYIPRIMFY